MANDSGGSNAVWIALIGLATTVAGGVFANWDRIFPPPADPATTLAVDPPAAGPAPDADVPPADSASEPAG